MSCRNITIACLIFATLVIPIVQLSFGFHYVDSGSCPLQADIMILMAIGGCFELIFFAAAFGFLYAVTPSKHKEKKNKPVANETVAQKSAQGSNRASLVLVGCITGMLGACAIIFFVLIQYRVYGNYSIAQWSNSTATSSYCIFPIYSSAFGLMIATYVCFILLFIVAIILLCGICVPKNNQK